MKLILKIVVAILIAAAIISYVQSPSQEEKEAAAKQAWKEVDNVADRAICGYAGCQKDRNR